MINFESGYFHYHGRWENTQSGMRSHWTRPYIEFNFKGDSLRVLCDNLVCLRAYVDGERRILADDGTLTVDGGEHLIRLRLECNESIVFYGIETDGEISKAPQRDKYYLFIGDSLTAAEESHSVVIPDVLKADYQTVSCGGLALRNGKGYYGMPSDRTEREGMESAFFNWQHVGESGERVKYPFSNERQPDAIFINLGTNDALISEEERDDFTTRYIGLVNGVRNIYRDCTIYVLLPKADHINGYRLSIIEGACQRAVSEIPNVKYVSSRNWDVTISGDGVHPTPEGYLAFANNLMRDIGLN